MDEITKEQAIEVAGGSPAQLARALGIRHQAVQQWASGKPIPLLRQYELREKFPGAFGARATEQRSTEPQARAA